MNDDVELAKLAATVIEAATAMRAAAAQVDRLETVQENLEEEINSANEVYVNAEDALDVALSGLINYGR